MPGALIFGREETVRCLRDLAIAGPGGEKLCLAHKFTVHNIVGPIYLTDDGYVLSAKQQKKHLPLTATEAQELQVSGQLPSPLPKYSISAVDYLFGYAFWILLALIVGLVVAMARSRGSPAMAPADIPLSNDPPVLETEGDRFIAGQVAAQLRPRERVTHQAYTMSADVEPALINIGVKGFFAALTDQRLILVETRVGPFRPRLENRGVESIERAAIVRGERRNRTVHVSTRDGSSRSLVVEVPSKRFSNQVRFLCEVPRLLAEHQGGEPGQARRESLLG